MLKGVKMGNNEILEDINESYYEIDKIYEKEEEKKREDNFDKFLTNYNNIFNQFSWNNEVYSKLLLHSLLSKIFDKIYISVRANIIDPRISLLLIQTQASGKGKGMIMIKKIIERLNINNENPIKINSISDYTDAGLIGTIVETKVGKEFINSVKLGVFSDQYSDIIYMEEAKLILASNKNRKDSNIFQYINTGLNSVFSGENVINKEMRLGRVSCRVNACFILTTYPTSLADIEGLKSGFYRRLLTYYNNLSINDLKENNTILTDSIITSESKLIEYEKIINADLDRLTEELKGYINNYKKMFKDGYLRVGIGSYVGVYIESRMTEYFKRYSRDLGEDEAKILLSILTSYENYALVIASHRAIINNTSIISREDIIYAFNIIENIMHGLEKYIDYVYENNSDWRQKESKKFTLTIKKILLEILKNKKLSKMELTGLIKEQLKLLGIPKSNNVIFNALKELHNEGFIIVEKEGKNSFVRLNN